MTTLPGAGATSELYEACVEAAIAQGEMLMQRMIDRSIKGLSARAAAANNSEEKKWLVEAGMFLPRHQDSLCKAYPVMLRKEFAATVAEETRGSKGLSFDSLELMAEDQVDETVEVVRAQQAVMAAVEFELAQLNGLVSAARGLSVVRTSVNPLRPDSWVKALRAATMLCPVPAGVRIRWMQQLGDALGAELAPVYVRLSDLLRSQGVSSAAYGVNQTSPRPGDAQNSRQAHQLGADSPPAQVPLGGGHGPVVYISAPGQQPGFAPSTYAPTIGGAAPPPPSAQHLFNIWDLRRLLLGDAQAGPPPAAWAPTGATTYSDDVQADPGVTVPAAFEALQEMKQVDRVVRRLQKGRPLSAAEVGFDTALAARPGGGDLTPAQALSIEVVKLMLDNIVADTRLLPAVQAAVRDLEPALLRLSVNDPRFFSDKHHPARQLLEQMTQRSLAWVREDAAGFEAFYRPLREAVDALVALSSGSAEPFEFALRTLDETWSEMEERERRQRAKAARALVKAEQRNMLAEKVAEQLRQRPDVAAAPNEIVRFLLGPWSQVIAAARLSDAAGTPDPGGHEAIINDLIWSAQPRLASANPARLSVLAPPVLSAVRNGLQGIEFPDEQIKRFMDYLADTHDMALRLAGVRTASTPRGAAGLPDAAGATDAPVEGAGDIWLAPAEAIATGLMDLPDTADPHQPFATTRPGLGDTQSPASEPFPEQPNSSLPPTGMQPGDLQAGTWVELQVEGRWIRSQLAWASPHSMLFMFTTSEGRSLSMTRRMLERMMTDGSLLIVSEQTLVDSALDAVAQTALRNSLDGKSS